MWVYVAVFLVVILFLAGSYRALGRDSELSEEQIGAMTDDAAEALKSCLDQLDSDVDGVRKTCAGWQLRLEPLRDVAESKDTAEHLIRGFGLLEWAAKLKIQAEKVEVTTFTQAATGLVQEATAIADSMETRT